MGAPRTRAILLDALGTLVALEPPAPLLRRQLALRMGVAIDEDQAQRAIAAEMAYYRRHLDEGRDRSSLAALRRRCAEVIWESLPCAARRAPRDLDLLSEALLAALRFRPYPEVPAALARFRARGMRLAVVSNWDASLPDVLERLGVASLLDAVITSAQIGSRKPSREIFELALHRVGASPEQAIHVGDGLREDVDGARAAGIEPVLIVRGDAPAPGGVRTIRSLDEL